MVLADHRLSSDPSLFLRNYVSQRTRMIHSTFIISNYNPKLLIRKQHQTRYVTRFARKTCAAWRCTASSSVGLLPPQKRVNAPNIQVSNSVMQPPPPASHHTFHALPQRNEPAPPRSLATSACLQSSSPPSPSAPTSCGTAYLHSLSFPAPSPASTQPGTLSSARTPATLQQLA